MLTFHKMETKTKKLDSNIYKDLFDLGPYLLEATDANAFHPCHTFLYIVCIYILNVGNDCVVKSARTKPSRNPA
jgi:hypothetical protein